MNDKNKFSEIDNDLRLCWCFVQLLLCDAHQQQYYVIQCLGIQTQKNNFRTFTTKNFCTNTNNWYF